MKADRLAEREGREEATKGENERKGRNTGRDEWRERRQKPREEQINESDGKGRRPRTMERREKERQ